MVSSDFFCIHCSNIQSLDCYFRPTPPAAVIHANPLAYTLSFLYTRFGRYPSTSCQNTQSNPGSCDVSPIIVISAVRWGMG